MAKPKIVAKKDDFIKARIRAGFSQKNLSQALGKSAIYINSIENGQPCSPKSAKGIAEKLGTQIDKIFLIS